MPLELNGKPWPAAMPSITLEPIGHVLIDSTPPAITMSCVPLMTPCTAWWMACCDEPHWRSQVVPGTDSGSREDSTTPRPMLPACAPTC